MKNKIIIIITICFLSPLIGYILNYLSISILMIAFINVEGVGLSQNFGNILLIVWVIAINNSVLVYTIYLTIQENRERKVK